MDITGYLSFKIIDDSPPPAPDWCFCLGLARSGSTVACELVSHHPQASMLREAWLWGYVELLRSTYITYHPDAYPINNGELLTAYRDGGIPATVVRAIMEGLRSGAEGSPRIFGDKNCRYLHFLDDLKRVFPECRLIVCLRDEWDTAASFMDSDWWLSAHSSVPRDQLAERTLRSVRTAHATAAKVIRELKPFVLHFEDMAAVPEVTINALLRYLELDPEDYDYAKAFESTRYCKAVGHWERVPELVALRRQEEAGVRAPSV